MPRTRREMDVRRANGTGIFRFGRSRGMLMRILLVASGYDSMAQRVHAELADRGHEVSAELAVGDEVLREGVRCFDPDLVLAPRPAPDPSLAQPSRTGRAARRRGAVTTSGLRDFPIAGLDQTRLVGEHDGLRPVMQAELAEG